MPARQQQTALLQLQRLAAGLQMQLLERQIQIQSLQIAILQTQPTADTCAQRLDP